MNDFILKLKNFGEYKSWVEIRLGRKPINMVRGTGYYFPTGLIGIKNKGRIERIKMQSGRTAVAELVNWNMHRDPDDMIKESFWHISGYEGEKPFVQMTFREYLKSAFGK